MESYEKFKKETNLRGSKSESELLEAEAALKSVGGSLRTPVSCASVCGATSGNIRRSKSVTYIQRIEWLRYFK